MAAGIRRKPTTYRQRAAELSQAHRGERVGWSRGTCARSTTTAHRSDRRRTMIARSIRSRNRGRSCPARAIQIARRKRWKPVADRLVNQTDQLVLLLAPPFDQTPRDPGYIKGYPPGIRENGAQYTHAATWAVWAFAELGQGDRAEALFHLLNPIYHSDTPDKVARYMVEPYVIAADVYSAPTHTDAVAGRGTPAPAAGCIAWDSKRSSVSGAWGRRCRSIRAFPKRGRVIK